MEQKDYFLRYIEQLGKVMAVLMGLRDKGEAGKMLEVINEAYMNLLKVDSEYLKSLSEEVLLKVMIDKKELVSEQLEVAAELLLEEANIHYENNNLKECKGMYKKSLILFNHLHEMDRTFSFERIDKMERIKLLLKGLNR